MLLSEKGVAVVGNSHALRVSYGRRGISSVPTVKLRSCETLSTKTFVNFIRFEMFRESGYGKGAIMCAHMTTIIPKVIETETSFYVIMEYAPGGELFDYIITRERLDVCHYPCCPRILHVKHISYIMMFFFRRMKRVFSFARLFRPCPMSTRWDTVTGILSQKM